MGGRGVGSRDGGGREGGGIGYKPDEIWVQEGEIGFEDRGLKKRRRGGGQGGGGRVGCPCVLCQLIVMYFCL